MERGGEATAAIPYTGAFFPKRRRAALVGSKGRQLVRIQIKRLAARVTTVHSRALRANDAADMHWPPARAESARLVLMCASAVSAHIECGCRQQASLYRRARMLEILYEMLTNTSNGTGRDEAK